MYNQLTSRLTMNSCPSEEISLTYKASGPSIVFLETTVVRITTEKGE